MLSRVADSLFWLSQNIERADRMAKLLSVRLISILENSDPINSDENDWKEVIEITCNKSDYLKLYSTFDRHSVIYFVAFSKENMNSIYSCVSIARENAKMIREIIPIELYEVINELFFKIKEFSTISVTTEQLNDFFQMIHEKYFLAQGVIASSMPRSDCYSFFKFGKYLETIRKTVSTIDVYYDKELSARFDKDDITYHYWTSVLKSLSVYESYVQKNQAFMDPKTVINYVLLDEKLPRSAKYSAYQLLKAFQELENHRVNPYSESLNNKIHELLEEVSYQSLEHLNIPLHAYFQKLLQLCDQVGFAIMETYYLGEIKST
ncbi:alpha-E domain-containing protein [Bacillus sp. 03113]|uniref:alpha-E domain-containing protein n=1 Tax=Bacillus sp. 03113 TaxID=2578211 RepID=UPI00114419DE|nr:alpha-E domain-containing protein [Bacillus sp. 03113]